RRSERFLHGFFSGIKRAGQPNERGDNAPRLPPEHFLDRAVDIIHSARPKPAAPALLLRHAKEAAGWAVSRRNLASLRMPWGSCRPRLLLRLNRCSRECSIRPVAL